MKVQFNIMKTQTLHEWCKEFMPHLSYNQLQTSLRKKDIIIKLDGLSYKCTPQDTISLQHELYIWNELLKQEYIQPQNTCHITKNMNLDVIYENNDYIVINKHAGIPSQGGSKLTFSLVDIIRDQYGFAPYIVHRLDKDVSGVMVVAKNVDTARKLSESLRNRLWHKQYIGILNTNKIPNPQNGIIEDDIDGKMCQTQYQYLGKSDQYNDCIIMQLEPVTGRKHQLRIHCARYFAPIIGDDKYQHLTNEPTMLTRNVNKKYKLELRCVSLQFNIDNQVYRYAL